MTVLSDGPHWLHQDNTEQKLHMIASGLWDILH